MHKEHKGFFFVVSSKVHSEVDKEVWCDCSKQNVSYDFLHHNMETFPFLILYYPSLNLNIVITSTQTYSS